MRLADIKLNPTLSALKLVTPFLGPRTVVQTGAYNDMIKCLSVIPSTRLGLLSVLLSCQPRVTVT